MSDIVQEAFLRSESKEIIGHAVSSKIKGLFRGKNKHLLGRLKCEIDMTSMMSYGFQWLNSFLKPQSVLVALAKQAQYGKYIQLKITVDLSTEFSGAITIQYQYDASSDKILPSEHGRISALSHINELAFGMLVHINRILTESPISANSSEVLLFFNGPKSKYNIRRLNAKLYKGDKLLPNLSKVDRSLETLRCRVKLSDVEAIGDGKWIVIHDTDISLV